MSVQINGTNGLTFSDASVQNTAATGFGFKNRIINGGMTIDQRNTGASVTPTSTVASTYNVDRWNTYATQASKFSVQQNAGSVTPPVGFKNYVGVTSLSAYSVTSTDWFTLRQFIEGYNISDLAWGTASAAAVTLSFWVRSSLTGTFGGAIGNSAGTQQYPFSFTISASNTWEQKTVTIAGPTSGVWATDNTIGLIAYFNLGAGSSLSGTAGAWTSSVFVAPTGATSVVGTNGATFYITGVQLEKGSTATSFDYRPYGTELALCQRYYYRCTNYVTGLAINANITYGSGVVSFPVTMRAVPTLDSSGNSFEVNTGSAGSVGMYNSAGLRATQNSVSTNNTSNNWTLNAAVCVSAGFSAEL